jgi:hypothetical protein
MSNAKQAARNLKKIFLDFGAIVGAAFFLFGLYLIWHPLAPLVGGLLLAAACLFAGYDQTRTDAMQRSRGGL